MTTDVAWSSLYRTARKNAGDRDISFNLTFDEFLSLVRRADGRCMVTGIPFEFERLAKGYRRPFAPSIDRINSSKGYQPGNVRLVCVVVNLAMNEWGVRPLMRVARYLVEREEAERPQVEAKVLRSTEYFTSREYVDLVDGDVTNRHIGQLTIQVRKYCIAHGAPYMTVNVPVRQRKDGLWIFETQWAFPRSAFEACFNVGSADVIPALPPLADF